MSIKTSQAHPEQSMSTPRRSHPIRWIIAILFALATGIAQAQITNGGFEDGTFTGWTKAQYTNSAGLSGNQPYSSQSIQRGVSPGPLGDLTFVRPAGFDTNVGGTLVAYPRFGTYCAVVNFGGSGKNANSLSQTFTLNAGMKDPSDNLIHIRFAFLPVLSDGGHTPPTQAYFYVGLKTSGGVTLYDNLNFAPSAVGGPWLSSGGTGYLYTTWQLQDIALPLSYLGQSVTIEFIGASCTAGGHAGYVYVDGISPTVSGLWVSATADRANVVAGGTITYTYKVHNDSGADRTNVTLTANLPSQTTLNASSGLGNHGPLLAGTSYTATLTVNVDAGAMGSIVHNDFFTTSSEESKLYGPSITTGIMGASTDLGVTLASATSATCNRVVYTATVTNHGPNLAKAAALTFNLPANSTLVSSASSQGTATGLGPITASFGDIASSGTATLTVTVTLTDSNTATATASVSGDFTDPTPANDSGTTTFTPPAALSISTHPASGSYFNGTVGSLTVAASAGWGTKSYQWYSGASGVTTTPVGGNSTSYTVPTGTDGSYSYWVRVTDACGSVDSTAATILVYSTHNITASAGANGSISPTGVTAVTHGSNQGYTITPSTGYHVLDLLVDGASAGAVTSYTFTNVTAAHTIAASFAINVYNLTYTAGANGTLTGTATQAVNHGASGSTVTAVPDTGYHFTTWSDGVATASRTDAAVSGAISVTASFVINTYNLTYTAGANGTLTGTATQAVSHGASGTAVTAVPNTGYHFTTWSDGVTTSSRTDAAVSGAISVSASFVINTYTLTYTAGANGTLTGTATQTVSHGASGTAVTAVPNTGYHFTTWSDGVTTASRTDAAVTGAISVSASFVINTYTLTYSAGANGTLTGTAAQTVSHGASGTAVTAVPNTGYHFTSWSDGVTTASRTDAAVTGAISVSASFAINVYTLTYTAGANGTLTGTATQTVNHGASGTAVTAVPNTGYRFISWSDGLSTASRTDAAVTSAISVSASFALNTYTLTYTAGANGTLTGTATQTVNHGASGTAVTAVPNTGYHFTAWSDGLATATRTDVAVTGAISVTASFAINTFTIQASVVGSGQAYPTGTQVVAFDSNSTFIFTPGAGKRVGNVLVDGVSLGPVLTYTFTSVRANHVLSVVFDDAGRFTIVGNPTPLGSLAPGQTFANAGDCLSLYITPDRGFHVTDVQINGTSVGAVTEYRIASVKENVIVTATFAADDFKVTTTVLGNGEVSPSLVQGITSGADLTLHFLPAEGCAVQDVQLDGRSIGAVSSYTFRNVQADCTVVVRFTTR